MLTLAIRAASLVLVALLVCAGPAAAQQQIDPSVPTNIPPEDRDDFKGFLDQVMDDILATNGPTIVTAGHTLWRGLAAIVVVWTGLKIAMSGTFAMWTLIELVIGLWIPWVMLMFYSTPIPGVGFTFPGMIAGGGAMVTLIVGTSMMFCCFVCLLVLYAVTYAQVIWAHVAILILTFLGPLMIPWLVFEPMAFLFWGWFRSMITFALYGAVAGAIMRVFLSVSLGYVTSFSANAAMDSPQQMVSWLLIVLPLMVAGVMASLKVGELAGMLVSGGGGGGAGMTGALITAVTGGKAMLAGKAASAAGVSK